MFHFLAKLFVGPSDAVSFVVLASATAIGDTAAGEQLFRDAADSFDHWGMCGKCFDFPG